MLALTAHRLSQKNARFCIDLFVIQCIQKKIRVHGQFLCAKNNLMWLAYSHSHKFVRPHMTVCIHYSMVRVILITNWKRLASYLYDLSFVVTFAKFWHLLALILTRAIRHD